MEDHTKYFMIKQALSQQFNEDQWSIIKSEGSEMFMLYQQQLLKKLMNNQKLYKKHFKLFYENHVKLVHWYILATRNKQEIQQYVFKPLVNHRITFYNEKIKEAFIDKQKKIGQKSLFNTNQLKEFQEQLMNDFFKDILVRNQRQNTKKPLNLKLYKRTLNTQEIDGHQIYLRTFDACNGRRYIYYDYEKHMKGMKQRYKYNAFLRTNHEKKPYNYKQQLNNLSKFTEFDQARKKDKCALFTFNSLLNDHSLNSESGLRKILKSSKSDKLVCVNHLGKPITYKLSKPLR